MRKTSYATATGSPGFTSTRDSMLGQIYARITAYLRASAAAAAERRRARDGMKALMAMGERELKDIGLSRSQILSAAYGPMGPERGEHWR